MQCHAHASGMGKESTPAGNSSKCYAVAQKEPKLCPSLHEAISSEKVICTVAEQGALSFVRMLVGCTMFLLSRHVQLFQSLKMQNNSLRS